jgi:LiaF transmembrane domain
LGHLAESRAALASSCHWIWSQSSASAFQEIESMTTRRRQGNLVFPLFLVFLGLMFLLINLGVVDRSVWSDIIRFWPVLLILMGIDTLLRRSSASAAIGTLFGTGALIVAGIILFQLFAPASWITETQSFSHALSGASKAEVVLACRDCSLTVTSGAPSDALITGTLAVRRDEKLTESVRTTQETARFELNSESWLPFELPTDRGSHQWNARLNGSIPLELSLQTQGPVDLDLTGLNVSSADVSAGDERCKIILATANTTLFLAGERIEVLVPSDVAVRISGSASTELAVPADYVHTPNGIHSPNYATAPLRTEVVLRSGTKWIEFKDMD